MKKKVDLASIDVQSFVTKLKEEDCRVHGGAPKPCEFFTLCCDTQNPWIC